MRFDRVTLYFNRRFLFGCWFAAGFLFALGGGFLLWFGIAEKFKLHLLVSFMVKKKAPGVGALSAGRPALCLGGVVVVWNIQNVAGRFTKRIDDQIV